MTDREQIEQAAHDVGTMIGEAIRERHPNAGFALLVFTFGERGDLAYVSNADRDGVFETLLEWLEKHVSTARDMPLEKRLAIGKRCAELGMAIGRHKPWA